MIPAVVYVANHTTIEVWRQLTEKLRLAYEDQTGELRLEFRSVVWVQPSWWLSLEIIESDEMLGLQIRMLQYGVYIWSVTNISQGCVDDWDVKRWVLVCWLMSVDRCIRQRRIRWGRRSDVGQNDSRGDAIQVDRFITQHDRDSLLVDDG